MRFASARRLRRPSPPPRRGASGSAACIAPIVPNALTAETGSSPPASSSMSSPWRESFEQTETPEPQLSSHFRGPVRPASSSHTPPLALRGRRRREGRGIREAASPPPRARALAGFDDADAHQARAHAPTASSSLNNSANADAVSLMSNALDAGLKRDEPPRRRRNTVRAGASASGVGRIRRRARGEGARRARCKWRGRSSAKREERGDEVASSLKPHSGDDSQGGDICRGNVEESGEGRAPPLPAKAARRRWVRAERPASFAASQNFLAVQKRA